MENQQPVNITIFKDHEEKIKAASNMSEAYIILANEALNNRLRESENTIAELNAQIETLTEDNSRMEVTVTNQRGLLQNFHALNNLEKTISGNYGSINEAQKEQIKAYNSFQEEFQNHVKNSFVYFAIMILISLSMGILKPMAFFMTVINLFSSYYLGMVLHPIKPIKSRNVEFYEKIQYLNKMIKEDKNTIENITSRSDFVSDYIDSI